MDKTLAFYAQNHEQYIADTVNADMSATRTNVLKLLKPGAMILDLGCGSGRDSLAFKQLGYKVTAVDGSPEFAAYAEKLIGQKVICATFSNLELSNGSYNLVWACASLLHVPYKELPAIIKKISGFLKPEGIFYMSFKYGTFEGERDGRYYTDLDEKRLDDVIKLAGNLKIHEAWISKDVRAGVETKWFNVIMQKS
jgi:SAM-dependent methyltransferase